MPVRRPVCLICLFFLFIIYIMTKGRGPKSAWDIDAASGRTITVTGTVYDRQEKNGSFQVFLKNVTFSDISEKSAAAYFPDTSKGIVVKLSETDKAKQFALIGSHMEARGVFAPFEPPRCEGQFDTRSYYLIRGYDGMLKRARITGVSKNYGRVREGLRRLRDRAVEVLKDNMEEDDAGLVAAMTLGDKTYLDDEIKQLYQNAGISHVLALSGLHIASVGLALLHILKKTGIPATAASVISFLTVSAYAVMTGMSTSTERAMIMFGLFVVSSVLGRTYDLLSAAALSAVMILVRSPYYAYDTGFLLSFGAVVGIGCVYPILVSMPGKIREIVTCSRPEANHPKVPEKIFGLIVKVYQSVCISLSVMIVTLPVMGSSFMQMAMFSVIINIVVVPLMSLVLFTGFAGVILGILGVRPTLIFKITHFILWFYRALAEKSEKIDGNMLLIGKPSEWQIITYAFIAITAVITSDHEYLRKNIITHMKKNVDRDGRHNQRNNGNYPKIRRDKITYRIETEKDRTKNRSKKLAILIITAVMVMAAVAVLLIHPRSDLEIRNVDVGQGDCCLIWGRDIPAVMIDGGSSDIKQAGKYRVAPVLKANRIGTVECCFLTHMDSDHVSAVIDMLSDDSSPIRIKEIIVSEYTLKQGRTNENFATLSDAAEKRGTRIVCIRKGMKLTCGKLVIECISPGQGITDINEASLVLKLKYDTGSCGGSFSGIFTGDIGESTERSIRGNFGDVTYLKVAHHGSRMSTSKDFLDEARPKISVISCGVDNSYGHPHKETVDRLESCCPYIYRTDECGEVILTVDDGEMSVKTVLAK